MRVFTNNNYYFFPILKNASQWGEKFFKKHHFIESDYENNSETPNHYFIIFLRDPIERWYSAVAEYITLLMINDTKSRKRKAIPFREMPLDVLHLDLLFSRIHLDGHTLPQVEILETLIDKDPKKTFYFSLDDTDFNTKFVYFCNNKVSSSIKFLPKPYNTSKSSGLKLDIISRLKKAVDTNSKYKKNLYDFYRKDIDFTNSCNYYTIPVDAL